MIEKLPLPKEWYKSWDLDRPSNTAQSGRASSTAAPGTGTSMDAMEDEQSKLSPLLSDIVAQQKDP